MIDPACNDESGGHGLNVADTGPNRLGAGHDLRIDWMRRIPSATRIVPPFLLCLAILTAAVPAAQAGTATNTNLPEFRHGLENMRFVGEWTYEWETEPVEGLLIFEDGEFVSRGCLEWGYEPAPYYVRRDDEGLHFHARLPNPDHGTMWFRGVFDGEQLQVDVHWRKERWYWTLEQEYRFTGRPMDRAASPLAVDAGVE